MHRLNTLSYAPTFHLHHPTRYHSSYPYRAIRSAPAYSTARQHPLRLTHTIDTDPNALRYRYGTEYDYVVSRLPQRKTTRLGRVQVDRVRRKTRPTWENPAGIGNGMEWLCKYRFLRRCKNTPRTIQMKDLTLEGTECLHYKGRREGGRERGQGTESVCLHHFRLVPLPIMNILTAPRHAIQSLSSHPWTSIMTAKLPPSRPVCAITFLRPLQPPTPNNKFLPA
jgi:hypothetical protein